MKWSTYAGVYAFLWGTVLLLLLYPITNTLVKLLGLPTGYSAFLLAGPAVFIGAGVWWAVVERREAYTYPPGVTFGLATALSTVLFWVLVYTIVWGPVLVLAGWLLVVFVFVVTLPAAFVAGLTSMYARRRLDDGLPDGNGRGPEQAPGDE